MSVFIMIHVTIERTIHAGFKRHLNFIARQPMAKEKEIHSKDKEMPFVVHATKRGNKEVKTRFSVLFKIQKKCKSFLFL